MPFGLANAPSVFQEMLGHFLSKFLGKEMTIYLKDILIVSMSALDHYKKLREYRNVNKKNFKIKNEKCEFKTKEAVFFG
jgi:hypothetical protein